MSLQHDDSDLRKLFAELRESDRHFIPPFQRVWDSSRLRIRPLRLGVRLFRFVAVLVVFVLLGIYVVSRPEIRTGKQRAAVSLSGWKAPTDFLLKTPGIEVLQSVPTFETPPRSGHNYEPNQTQE